METHPIAKHVQCFFTGFLETQLGASQHTIASYRDTFSLLLRHVSAKLNRAPSDLDVTDLSAEIVGEFLSFIEVERGNCAQTRNNRLSAIRSFFKYLSPKEPQLLHHCQRVLAIRCKRYEKRTIDYLNHAEIQAVVAAPDLKTWFGRRDQALLLLGFQTGLRVSELISLACADVVFGTGAHVHCMGKGRKERSLPLRKDCQKALRAWVEERAGEPDEPLFISNRGTQLSRDAVERIVRKHTRTASSECRTLAGKRVTPHVLRHSAAMQLLLNKVDLTVIALWLGHESVETTQMYLHADMKMREEAMAKTDPVALPAGRYRPTDNVLAFLDSL